MGWIFSSFFNTGHKNNILQLNYLIWKTLLQTVSGQFFPDCSYYMEKLHNLLLSANHWSPAGAPLLTSDLSALQVGSRKMWYVPTGNNKTMLIVRKIFFQSSLHQKVNYLKYSRWRIYLILLERRMLIMIPVGVVYWRILVVYFNQRY